MGVVSTCLTGTGVPLGYSINSANSFFYLCTGELDLLLEMDVHSKTNCESRCMSALAQTAHADVQAMASGRADVKTDCIII